MLVQVGDPVLIQYLCGDSGLVQLLSQLSWVGAGLVTEQLDRASSIVLFDALL